jgi:hypothetical protein
MSVLLTSLLLAASLATARPAATVDQLAWMAGHWSAERGSRTVEEHWMKPSGGTMIGMGRTVSNGKAVEFEFLQIKQEGEEIHYVARPNGSAPTSFKLVKLTEAEAVFENPKHDFPQRVLYRKQADGSVSARIEGEVNGKARAVDFPYKRAKCTAENG